jgi:predicted lipoprotein with Yx(FWY)xxD motif
VARSQPFTSLGGALGVVLAVISIAGCGGSSNAATVPPKTANGHAATISLANEGNLGKILVDSKGHTLYLFQKDSGTTSTCTGACASAWPPLRASGKPVVGAGLTASKVATSARSDGKPQVTYNGHPLYLFQGDHKPGDTTGEGSTAFGAGWFAVSSAGNKVSGSSTSSSPTSGGGSGY